MQAQESSGLLGFTAYAGDFTEDPGVLIGESVDDSQNISYEA